MIKKMISCILICSVLAVSAMTTLEAINHGLLPTSLQEISSWADHAVKLRLGRVDGLDQLAPSMLLFGGAKEQDGIFITRDYLLENIAPENPDVLEENLAGVEAFLQNHNIPSAFLLIPTACVIKQQDIPARAELYNQKALISECYARLSGQTSTVDAYSKLFAAKEQYTYFRTESNLTGLGGYYVYTALAPRLGFSARPLDQFAVENLALDYYGELYHRSSYKGIKPDLLTLYRFSRFSRQYQLSCTDNNETRNYYSLFPTHLIELNQPRNAILGGFGQRLDISVVSPYEESLLVFSDETMLSYLPFLVVHYGNITLVNLQSCTPEQLAALPLDDYDKVLFAYSVDNFIHAPVSALAATLP